MRQMRQRINLDLAATEIGQSRPRWLTDGVHVSPLLWTDDREHLAVRFASAGWAVELAVEVHHSGWTHLHFVSQGQTVQETRRAGSLQAFVALLDNAVARAARISLQPAQLLAATCTTGWLDWVHGELWLLPDHLVRIRGGLLATMVTGLTGPELAAPDTRLALAYDAEAIHSAHRTNKVLPLAEVAHARLHGGLTTSGMTLTMADGSVHKLLWMSTEPARRVLRDRLPPLLGPRLTH
ncbi:hypothetical protein ACH4HG_01380 [Streptomyces coeruleorubidus]|uniref:Uncharacterized protein n=1 Tax=Streptomyces coeruleorubidus TaxID=116188 RepID=A0ABZ0KAB1_STRC4|nr:MULTISPECIES: hypothetical protein [Streptomyces]WOT34903.1 hypothetical protein R5U08_12510 [Streptomyces coeruleorubidus]